jgi:serine/threonine protein kinase/Flp pilus assembly protein TadD
MTSVLRLCPKCGAEIPADAPEGGCPGCLLETGLGLLTGDHQEAEHAFGERVPPGKTDRIPSTQFADFGDYELLEEIGRGGQGVVFRACQKSLNRTVALKVIGVGRWATKAHLKRFRLEAEAAARLDHPGIVPIHEVGERDGSCYFSMKFVEGGQLDAVARREPMPIRRAVEVIVKVARTVHYAHEHGIVHRDIKPGNILLDQKGEPHLTDFGLARLVETESTVTRTLEVLGTPSYMAPEQAGGNNAELTAATDVYGLGAVLYQLLTGHAPFAGGTTYETIKLLLETEPRRPRLWNPKIDPDLSTICLKCLEKDPKLRYSSALALAEDLERWLKYEPILARHTGIVGRSRKWVQRNPTSALLAASLIALAAAAGWIISKSDLIRQSLTTGIAVLPFENLSDEKEHAFFADGVQDDILIKLAKIADLKVISRSSVMQYRGKQDVRQIGNALRVSHVLEGTVRRSAGKLHVNAQLVDTRTDEDIWADEYDRDVNDVFAIETEVAESIANRLRAKVSAREKAAMQEWPTKDLVAYDYYIRAISLLDGIGFSSTPEKDLSTAADLLNQAVARDPSFLLAYCRLAEAHDGIYFFTNIDRTPARLALAKSAIDSAFRLKPDSGEAHLALALHFYRSSFDYDHARAELALARQVLPNDPKIFNTTALIDRRQGRWPEALRNFERASELDPRNVHLLNGLAGAYWFSRAYAEADNAFARVLAIDPKNSDARLSRAFNALSWRADIAAFRAAVEKIKADDPAFAQTDRMKTAMLMGAVSNHDFVAANRIAETLPENDPRDDTGVGRQFWKGVVARVKGDATDARSAFTIARVEQEEVVRRRPDDVKLLCGLGLIDAGLGRKEEALREGRRAVELMPVAKDSLDGPGVLTEFAQICAWTGERDLAIQQLEIAAKIPAGPDYGDLRLNPMWDPLRGDPRFEKIVNSLAPR